MEGNVEPLTREAKPPRLFCRVHPQRPEDGAQLLGGDIPAAVGVEPASRQTGVRLGWVKS